jgi:hypothetical protein
MMVVALLMLIPCDRAKDAIDTHGMGLASVRFICGTQDLHKNVCRRIVFDWLLVGGYNMRPIDIGVDDSYAVIGDRYQSA